MNDINGIIANIEKYQSVCKDYNATLVLATKYANRELLQYLASIETPLIFGENKVQDFKEKYFVSPNVKWHFIGRLQTNKVKYLVGKVDLIQSVDRPGLLKEISRQSKKLGIKSDILIEVNVGKEEQKGGVSEENFDELLNCCDENVNVKGIMSVFPKNCDVSILSKKVRLMSEKIKSKFGNDASISSIGMSKDYSEALENGSNMIRLGKAIFPTEE